MSAVEKGITCTNVSALDRPLCSGNIYTEKLLMSYVKEREKISHLSCVVSHQLAVLIIGQDLRDVPVSGCDGLQRVRAGVRLWRESDFISKITTDCAFIGRIWELVVPGRWTWRCGRTSPCLLVGWHA